MPPAMTSDTAEAEKQPQKQAAADGDTSSKIVRQLEYYFGDINFSKDKFMQEQAKLDEGWFTLETMLKFKRLRALAETPEAVVAALKKLPSELLELNDDQTKLRRCTDKPLPESFREAVLKYKDTAIYAKGFPDDATLEQVEQFLEKHGPTLHIQLRKDINTKKFKGSVYATFKDKESAEAFLKDSESKFRDSIAITDRMWREQHFTQKKEKQKKDKEEATKRRAEADAKRQEQRAQAEKERLLAKIVRGSLLKLDGVSQPEANESAGALFQELRSALGDSFAKENYLDFYEGNLYARFKEENAAAPGWAKICEAHNGKVMFKDKELTGSVPSGEEEERLWALVMQARQQYSTGGRGGRSGGRGGGRGRGRGGRGGRGGGDGPPAKRPRPAE